MEEIERFQADYIEWREKRINLVLNLYGEENLKGKTLLELGSGLGHVSNTFYHLGAITTTAEGRYDNIEQGKILHPYLNFIQLDQDGDWEPVKGRVFDIIIHWGVLYHLNSWQSDIMNVSECMHDDSVLFIESEVLRGTDPECEVKAHENDHYWDTALNAIGTRATANRIESVFGEFGLEYTRYDTNELNVTFHTYSWEADPEFIPPDVNVIHNMNDVSTGHRRFWQCKRKV